MFAVAIAAGGYYILLWPGLGLMEAGGQQQQRRRDRDQHGAGRGRRALRREGQVTVVFSFADLFSNKKINYLHLMENLYYT